MGKKRQKSDNSKTGYTPPEKTSNKMATTNQNNTSHVLLQANETLHGPYLDAYRSPIHTNYVNSPNQLQSYQIMPPPSLQSTPLQQVQTQGQGVVNQNTQMIPTSVPFLPVPTQYNELQSQSSSTAAPQMMNDMSERLRRLEKILTEKLSKLDLLDSMARKLDSFETNIYQMRLEIDEIKETQVKNSSIIEKQENHHNIVEERLVYLENFNGQLQQQNVELKEKFLSLQTHSMKYNLIFDGIRNTTGFEENTEAVLREFLTNELEVPDVENIRFQNVHRLGERRDRRERGIIARFVKFSEHETVRKYAANINLNFPSTNNTQKRSTTDAKH